MTASRLILFAARWAIMSGLAGTVFAVLVFTDEQPSKGGRGMLLAAAALLSIAFVLAPFVRNALAGAQRERQTKNNSKTLLEEMRDTEGSNGATSKVIIEQDSNPRATLMARLLIALYIVFGAALAAVVWSMS
jgi:multisubunit Na+/H+ antiporter MnhG subunit